MMTALLYSGLPNAREEVEALCAPLSYEELQQISGQLDAMQAEGQVRMAQAMLEQAVAGGQGEGQEPEAPPGTGAGLSG